MTNSYTLDTDETPSEGIYTFIAELENCTPFELEPLAATTDPEALDSILSPDSDVEHVTFWYHGYLVRATDSEIRVTDTAGEKER